MDASHSPVPWMDRRRRRVRGDVHRVRLRFGRHEFLRITYLGMMLAMLIWAVAGSLPWLIAFTAVFGVFYGGWVAVLPSVVMDRFGRRNVSSVTGVLYTSVAFGTLIGPTVAGILFDMTSSYLLPILAAVAANFAAALVSGFNLQVTRTIRPRT